MHRIAIAPALVAPLCAALVLAGPQAAAEPAEGPVRSWKLEEAAIEDVLFDLKLAIEGRGFVVDHISHVGDMLNRTAAAVGAERQVYEEAQVVQFCSATLSREMMEADPANIAFCPYSLFVYQTTGAAEVTVGFRRMPEGEMQKVETLLEEIVEEAVGF